MRRSLLVLALLAVAAPALHARPDVVAVDVGAPAAPQRITDKTRLIAGSLLVRPPAAAKDPQSFTRALSKELGVPLTFRRQLVLGWVLLRADGVDDEDATLRLVERAKKAAGVRGAAAEWVMRALATPGDPLFQFMWHLDAIGARAAWDITQGRSVNRVGVVDTGTAFSHEDLQGKRGAEFDFISDTFQSADGDGRDDDATDPGDIADCNGDGQFDAPSSFHGTHVAGTILAGGDNGTGITGINWNAKVVTGRALGRCGGTTVDIDEAVAWMAGFQVDVAPGLPPAERPRVVNLSLGATGAPCDDFTDSVWSQVVAQGVVIVVAAGNDGNDVPVGSPANCPDSLAVAAYGPQAGHPLATYSNFGPEIAIVAPGGDQSRSGVFEDGVLSSIDASVSPFQDGTPYTFYEGTSMATPHVTGVVSLMLDVNPGLSVQDIKNLIKSSSDSCNGCGGKPALRADLAVAAAAGTTVVTNPGDSCAGTGFCSSAGAQGQVCANVDGAAVCLVSCGGDGDCGSGEACASLAGGARGCVDDGGGVPASEGEGEDAPDGACDPRRGNLDCDAGSHCEEDDGVTFCEDGEGDVGVGGLCDFDRDCSTGLCDRGVCTVTCDASDDGDCRDGYSCDDDVDVPGGLCRADSCVDDPAVCTDGFACSYSSDSRYVCAVGPSNYLGVCGAQPASWAPIPVAGLLALLLRRRRR
jgi:serine protease